MLQLSLADGLLNTGVSSQLYNPSNPTPLITGDTLSTGVSVCSPEDVLPQSSVAIQVLVIISPAQLVPVTASVKLIVAVLQSSLAVGLHHDRDVRDIVLVKAARVSHQPIESLVRRRSHGGKRFSLR